MLLRGLKSNKHGPKARTHVLTDTYFYFYYTLFIEEAYLAYLHR